MTYLEEYFFDKLLVISFLKNFAYPKGPCIKFFKNILQDSKLRVKRIVNNVDVEVLGMIKYEEKSIIELLVNGQKISVMVRPSDILLEVLRDQLGLTGAKPRM